MALTCPPNRQGDNTTKEMMLSRNSKNKENLRILNSCKKSSPLVKKYNVMIGNELRDERIENNTRLLL